MKHIKKIDAMHYYYGVDPQYRQCHQCEHLLSGVYHNRRYYKCTVYGCSHSEATDWRRSYTACGLIGEKFPKGDRRIKDRLNYCQNDNKPIEGQISIFSMEGIE